MHQTVTKPVDSTHRWWVLVIVVAAQFMFGVDAFIVNVAIPTIAVDLNATPAQIGLAWLLSQRPYIVPIPGTTKLHRLEENIGAAKVELTNDDLAKIDQAASHIQIEGERYAPAQMAMVGREAAVKEEA